MLLTFMVAEESLGEELSDCRQGSTFWLQDGLKKEAGVLLLSLP